MRKKKRREREKERETQRERERERERERKGVGVGRGADCAIFMIFFHLFLRQHLKVHSINVIQGSNANLDLCFAVIKTVALWDEVRKRKRERGGGGDR